MSMFKARTEKSQNGLKHSSNFADTFRKYQGFLLKPLLVYQNSVKLSGQKDFQFLLHFFFFFFCTILIKMQFLCIVLPFLICHNDRSGVSHISVRAYHQTLLLILSKIERIVTSIPPLKSAEHRRFYLCQISGLLV